MQRLGMIIRLRPGCAETYKAYHREVWPEVLDMLTECNMTNYSIYLKDDVLYGYLEYAGTDLEADRAKIAAHRKTQEWWAIMEPMQDPIETRKPGEWWAEMEEVFHLD